MTLAVSQEKVDKLISLCQTVLNIKEVSLQDLSSLIGQLIATSSAVTPACLQTRYLMIWQIQELKYSYSYTSKTQLYNLRRKELEWWIENLKINKGKSILTTQPDMIIQTDASLAGWGAHCQGIRTGGAWTQEGTSFHINVLELKAIYLDVLTFTTNKKSSHIHFQIDNTCAIAYLLKQTHGKHCEKDMGASPTIRDHNYC